MAEEQRTPKETNTTLHQICPHLGLRTDPSTSVGYPSSGNVCHHARNNPTPKLSYQNSTCLTTQHMDCEIYNAPQDKRMQGKIRSKVGNRFFTQNILLKIILFTGLIAVIFLAVQYYDLWFPKIDDFMTPSWQKTQQDPSFGVLPTRTVTITPTATLEPTSPIRPTRTPSPSPSAIPTITSAPSTLALDTPIGKNYKFIIHRAAPGESPGQYATIYNTTIEAFWAVNYNMPTVLYENRVVVIPLDITDASNLPAFEAYEIKEAGLTHDSLAEKLSADPEQVRLYNNVPSDYLFSPGEWVLIPRKPNQP